MPAKKKTAAKTKPAKKNVPVKQDKVTIRKKKVVVEEGSDGNSAA